MKLRILDRYIVREVLFAWLAVSVVLVLVLLSAFMGDYLTDVASGDVPPNLMISIVTLRMVRALTMVLPVAMFFALLLSLGRLYHDNEMAVLNACGVGQTNLIRPIALIVLPAAILLAVLSLWLAPLASYNYYLVRDQAARSLEFAGIVPGRFQPIGGDGRVLYAERVDASNNLLEHVFLFGRESGQNLAIFAETGRLDRSEEGARYLRLGDGEQIAGRPGQPNFRRLRFAENRMQVERADDGGVLFKRDSIDSRKVFTDPDPGLVAERHVRLAAPVSMLVLALVALPLSRTSPRQGRYGKLLIGILVYVVYSNLMNVGQVWLQQQVLPPIAGFWWAHALVASFGALLLWLQVRRRRLRGQP